MCCGIRAIVLCVMFICSFRDCNGFSCVHLAAACGHVGILSSLLQVCGTGNITDNHGFTPLHWACYNGE